MDVSGVGNGSGSGLTRSGIASNFDQFLFLLTQQLQNQDPLQPMDTAQFTNQLVQFANVEQGIKTNENIQNLIALQQANTNVGMLGYIGKEVEVIGDKLPLEKGKEAKFKYALPEKADVLTIKIKDKDGHVVRDLTGDLDAGAHDITWDGKDNQGNELDSGTYTIEVNAVKNTNGVPKTLETFTAIVGKVTGINTSSGFPSILIGNVAFGTDYIVSVKEPQV